MGRGDKKSKKGKRFKGSYGVVRPRKKNNDSTIKQNIVEQKVEKKIEEKKKTTNKKKTATKKKTTTKKKESKT